MLPEAPLLMLDSGNFSDSPNAQGDIKTRALLEGMEQMGYRAVNVGERDIRGGYPEFARRTEGSGLTFISANIVDRETQKPIFPPHAIIEAGVTGSDTPVRIGVIGVVRYNPLFLKAGRDGGNIVIAHPVELVQQQVAELQEKKVDLIVLLSALHKDDSRRIVEEVPGIHYILGSYGGVHTPRSEKAGQAYLQYCGNRGQRLGESRVFLGDDPAAPRIAREQSRMHFLTSEYPDDPEMATFVKAVKLDAPVASVAVGAK